MDLSLQNLNERICDTVNPGWKSDLTLTREAKRMELAVNFEMFQNRNNQVGSRRVNVYYEAVTKQNLEW